MHNTQNQQVVTAYSVQDYQQKLYIGLGLLMIWVFFGRYYYLCHEKNMCGADATLVSQSEIKLLEKTKVDLLPLSEGSEKSATDFAHFSVDTGSISPNITFHNQLFLLNIAAYLREHPTKVLNICGYYSLQDTLDLEANKTGIYDNLGIARAEVLREILIHRFRTNAEQVQTDALAIDTAEPYSFSVLPQTVENQKILSEGHFFENMTFSVTVNFSNQNAALTPSKGFLAYSDSLHRFLNKHPNHIVTITTHTDDTEKAEIGQERADAILLFFQQLGIKNKMKTYNAANLRPIAPKGTAEGRLKNRRINIQISRSS